jgi:hypothetical protein
MTTINNFYYRGDESTDRVAVTPPTTTPCEAQIGAMQSQIAALTAQLDALKLSMKPVNVDVPPQKAARMAPIDTHPVRLMSGKRIGCDSSMRTTRGVVGFNGPKNVH